MNILAFDSSSKSASCAVVKDSRLLSESFANTGFTHSKTLLPMIKDTLDTAGVSLDEIDLIAVTNGPGSFTGVRIGIATAKGLAKSGVKCAGVSSLKANAYNVKNFCGIICPVMDARCSQVYTALFSCDGKSISRVTGDSAMAISELCAILGERNEKICLVGDGAHLVFDAIKDKSGVILADASSRYIRGSSAAAAVEDKDILPAYELMPFYLRLPQAERELKARRQSGEA